MEDRIMGKKMIVLLVTLLYGCGEPQCQTKKSCRKDPECQCWCSQKCGYRKKTPSDRPIYVENDANGKTCYCKHWDLDNYKNNCKLKKHVKEPKDAK
jgi:hypothetical protein